MFLLLFILIEIHFSLKIPFINYLITIPDLSDLAIL